MSTQPQCPIEEIELIPHPLDAWRAALNALIAVAPGNSADIAYHLDDARKRTLICRDFTAATQGEAKLIDRLMLLGAGKLVGQQLEAHAPNVAQPQADSIRNRMMAEYALSEVHQHQARETERTKHHVAIRGKRPCPGCNHSPALLRLAGGVVPHDAACPHYKHPDTQRTQADSVAPSSKGIES